MTQRHHALVTGPHGIIGLNLVEELSERPDWKVTGIGRRPAPPFQGLDYLSGDLEDAASTRAALAGCGDVSHLFFAAFKPAADLHEEVRVNVAILENTLDGLRAAGAELQRVVIYQGSKAYGATLGAMRSPARESDPRVPGPLFYFDQEDLLYRRGAEDGFATTVLRPDFIAGVGLGSYVNLVHAVAVYGSVCHALDLPMYFPAGPESFETLIQLTDSRLLARGSVWAALESHDRDEIYNITNGDLFRWSHVWPRIADYFQVSPGYPIYLDLPLFMRDKKPLWEELKTKHQLVKDMEELVSWQYTGLSPGMPEIHTSTIKIRQAGFQDCLDSNDRMIELFDDMRARHYIP